MSKLRIAFFAVVGLLATAAPALAQGGAAAAPCARAGAADASTPTTAKKAILSLLMDVSPVSF